MPYILSDDERRRMEEEQREREGLQSRYRSTDTVPPQTVLPLTPMEWDQLRTQAFSWVHTAQLTWEQYEESDRHQDTGAAAPWYTKLWEWVKGEPADLSTTTGRIAAALDLALAERALAVIEAKDQAGIAKIIVENPSAALYLRR